MVLLTIYFVNDPFKTVYHYKSYFPENGIQYVILNNDYTAVETFLGNYKRQKYDSYIFGNSRGLLFHIDKWQNHVQGTCFQFSASNESLFGIERKIALIDERGLKIKNALLVIDHELYNRVDESSKFPKHPLLSGKSEIDFKINSLKGFFDKDFLLQYMPFLFTHNVKKTFFTNVLNTERSEYNYITNDMTFPDLDPSIDADTASYYGERRKIFETKAKLPEFYDKTLKDKNKELFKNIKKIFDKNGTKYKIIISPLYYSSRTNPEDYATLCDIFGKDNIFDFSGINEITIDKYNYYENSHFRPRIANKIMDSIYKK